MEGLTSLQLIHRAGKQRAQTEAAGDCVLCGSEGLVEGTVWRKARRGQFQAPRIPAGWQIKMVVKRCGEGNNWREI